MTSLYSYYIQVIFLSLIVVNHLFEIYLTRRQVTTLHRHRGEVPKEFASFLSLGEHQKAIQYAMSKLNLGLLKLIWNAALLFFWFPFRGAEKLELHCLTTGVRSAGVARWRRRS